MTSDVCPKSAFLRTNTRKKGNALNIARANMPEKKTCDAMQKSMPDSNLGTSLKLWTLQGFRYFVAQICFRKNGGT